ncbi:acyl-homoserine-lactone synthase [Microvirga thermotolerans]|uniref:Acyl-homoserine-lactone synthase n=1 Tax=Microvirga thermotolerans TaxID=2651334 RepID=A0A5P9K0G3_9HYPH|nr:acyl-homoserine-lactone synthase [Microvirga thermotolerans]QFU17396.1 GNAT family N-acetyltransferase [Microvirga thermotolerans]
MTSVHVITAENRSSYRSVLDAYHRARHDVFVVERGWRNLDRGDGRDIDAYDNDAAIYLIALEGDRPVGGLRLYPTLLPHMISETFPHLVRGQPLRGRTVFECTRYFVVRERRMGRTDCRLLAAFQQFCLDEGITEVTAVVEMWWLPRWQQAGFKVRPLGLPTLIENQPCLAVSIAVSHRSLEHLRGLAGLRGPCLVRRDLADTIVERVPHAAA